MKISSLHVLCEGYGRSFSIDYSNANIDPRPNVLALGRWINHKGTKLLCGVNLNYLSDDQVLELQKNLQTILGDRNLRRRVRKLRSLMPQIFDRAYRTYNQEHVRIIAPGTLKFYREPKPQPFKEPVTKAIEPIKAKKELKKPEDITKEINKIEKDDRGVDFDKEEPEQDDKDVLEKEKKVAAKDAKLEKGEPIKPEKETKKPKEKIKEPEPEKDANFGKSKPEIIKPEDLDFEEGEEDTDEGIPK
jgi:hypothetical protein